ncbi:hypothetical protein C8R44DRAFT_170821 [Mycena epipterygia]|nr:hypothetical protein C8R44DRAFT_170821 [Mycena epipterygia]
MDTVMLLILLGSFLLLCLTTTRPVDTLRNVHHIITECRATFAVAGELCWQSCRRVSESLVSAAICLTRFLWALGKAHGWPIIAIYGLRYVALNRSTWSQSRPALFISGYVHMAMGHISRFALATLSGLWSGFCSQIHPASGLEFLPVAALAAAIFRLVILEVQARTKPPSTPRHSAPKALHETYPQLQAIEASLQCCMCQDLLCQPYTLSPCGHSGCLECLQDWFCGSRRDDGGFRPNVVFRAKKCPLCRALVPTRPTESFALRDVTSVLSPPGRQGVGRDEGDPWACIFLQ